MTVHPPQGATPGATGTAPLGRDGEIERILRCVRREPGTPGTLLLLGDEGIGRTTLLRHVRERAGAEGVRVLAAQGWAGDPRPASACLRQLLASSPAAAAGPPPAVPPGDGRPDEDDLPTALTALLDRLGADRPVLVCVDDADLCDHAFLETLFGAGRLLADRALTLLLGARHEAALPVPPPGTETLRLGPLDAAAAAALLDRLPLPPTGRHRLEILAEAAGNPLALVELGRAAPGPAQAVRHAPAEHVFGARLAALPAATGRALLYAAAAEPDESVAAVMAALGTADLAVWAPAEAAGLVVLAEDRLYFRHPLARSAAGLRRPAAERQRAHRDLAEVAARPEARARHLAAATVGTDGSVAAALEGAAWRRGDAVRAARDLEQAARLSPGRPQRARRLAAALTAAFAVGDPDWTRELYGRLVQEDADPELLCVAAGALASALSHESAQREAFELLTAASEHFPALDPTVALALATLAAGITARSGLPDHRATLPTLLDRVRRTSEGEAGEAGEGAERVGQGGGAAVGDVARPVQAEGPLAGLDSAGARRAMTALVGVVGRPETAPGVRAGLGRPRRAPLGGADAPVVRAVLAAVAHHADEADTDLGRSRTAGDRLRAARAFGLRGWSVVPHVDTLLAVGRFTEAGSVIEDARAEAAVLRLPGLTADLEAQALTLWALRGAPSPEPRLTPSVWRAVCLQENLATHARLLRARGLVAVLRGDMEDGWRHLRALFTADGSPLHPYLSPRGIAELAVTAQRTGRPAEALPVLERVGAALGDRPSTRMTLLLHHATALVGAEREAEQHYQLALVNHSANRWPWECAHARLSYAIWLRRSRRTREARAQLTTVLETAEHLGAGTLADAAHRELRASGAAPAPEGAGPLERLTAQQRQIVQLVAGGLSNREIGERLFLSPRTVGSHLYKVYPILGISSRHQLRDLVQGR
ncbi:LuxR family transcriptional regulator [Streptomyces sp. NPDC013172]|uniref:helix-turn-helix transcriptional regulator n=1 Tax=Streptomyces sp. NPDC013172 TaxID=3155009 RepID=UPI0033E6C2C8